MTFLALTPPGFLRAVPLPAALPRLGLRHIHALLLALMTICIGAGAWAVEPIQDPLAQELKQRGDSAMVEGDYQLALESYERATAIEADPRLLYNRARALQALERYAESLHHFEAFKAQASAEVLALVPQLDELISAVRKNVTDVTFDIHPLAARVYIRGEEVPADLLTQVVQFDSGPALVRIVLAGYQTYERKLTLAGGQALTIRPELRALDASGILRVTSPVPGAMVLVDGKVVGAAPVELRLAEGEHPVVVQHEGYRTSETRAVVVSGESRRINVVLERKPSVLEKWWFWTAVGAVAVGGVVTAVALTSEQAPTQGDIPPGTLTVPFN